MLERILLIRTGGAIDAKPYADPHNPPEIIEPLKGDKSLVERTIEKMPNHEMIDMFHWGKWQEDRFVKDSQQFSAQDMHELADVIRNDPHHFFIITHGIDSLISNASILQQDLKGSGKKVVLTGAMVPLSMNDKHPSDGVPNLEHALKNITSDKYPPAVYVSARDAHTRVLAFMRPERIERDMETTRQRLEFSVRPR